MPKKPKKSDTRNSKQPAVNELAESTAVAPVVTSVPPLDEALTEPVTALSESATENEQPAAQLAAIPEAPPDAPGAGQPTSQLAKRKKSKLRFLVLAAILLALIGAGLVRNAQQSSDAERQSATNRQLVAEVAERAILPKNETPTITTVVDKTKANQSFLASAENGDKVLLYFQAGRAVLYRPSTKQIVNTGPLSQPPAKVFLRDGTDGDIPASIRRDLNQPAGFAVVSQDASAKNTYSRTLVIDLAGNRPDMAARAARLVGGQVAALPAGESRPEADILVIVGSDAQ